MTVAAGSLWDIPEDSRRVRQAVHRRKRLLGGISDDTMLASHQVLRPTQCPFGFACPGPRSQPVRRRVGVPARAMSPAVEQVTSSIKEDQAAKSIFVACNNFKVKPEHSGEFEAVWKSRDSHLKDFSGFIRFALLRGDEAGDYVSMTTWASRADFDEWRNSSQFVSAHQGNTQKQSEQQHTPRASMGEMLEGRPNPRFYEAVTVTES